MSQRISCRAALTAIYSDYGLQQKPALKEEKPGLDLLSLILRGFDDNPCYAAFRRIGP